EDPAPPAAPPTAPHLPTPPSSPPPSPSPTLPIAPDAMTDRAMCKKILEDLATKSSMPLHVIYNIGMSVAYDYQIDFLSDLWQRKGVPRGTAEGAKKAVDTALATPGGSPPTSLGARLVEAAKAGHIPDALAKELEEALRVELSK